MKVFYSREVIVQDLSTNTSKENEIGDSIKNLIENVTKTIFSFSHCFLNNLEPRQRK